MADTRASELITCVGVRRMMAEVHAAKVAERVQRQEKSEWKRRHDDKFSTQVRCAHSKCPRAPYTGDKCYASHVCLMSRGHQPRLLYAWVPIGPTLLTVLASGFHCRQQRLVN